MKTIVVTGASRGIGFDVSLQLCREGNRVIAIARNERGLENLYNSAQRIGKSSNLIVIPADLSAEMEIVRIVNRISEITPVVDSLINNAGALVNKSFESITRSELEQVYAVNVYAVFGLTQQLLPLLRRSVNAHVVNITSVGGITGTAKFGGLTAYSSSKGALSVFTEVLAEELKESNIRVNGLALGAVQTEMLESAFPGYKAPITSEEIAEFIGWFVINGHRFFNGKLLPVALSTP
jgi:NAD(P)-dependent dehydrogenase (short-subunit alcohol dehydrogenase family)